MSLNKWSMEAGGSRWEEIVLVHDYLIQMGGAERVVATMARHFPNAPICTSVTDYEGLLPEFRNRFIRNSPLQHLPGSVKHFKKLFPLYPAVFGGMKLPACRAVWISTSMFAKCVRSPVGAMTFCYCHNPPRFLWQPEEYIEGEVRGRLMRSVVALMTPMLKRVDLAAAARIDFFIANSANVQDRIRRIYGRESEVIHPPVAVQDFEVTPDHKGYYLVLSRLLAYKRIDRTIEAFNGSGRRLVVAGDGTDRNRLQAMAGPGVEIRGWVSDEERRRLLSGARAFLFPGDEDFGISPVEAQACGKPVIAFGKGGALETVEDGVSGVLFHEQTAAAVRDAVERFEKMSWDPELIRSRAERFSEAMFLNKMIRFMEERMGEGGGEDTEKLKS